ncbi:DUF6069 family protein [Actinocorallia sp. B10E7]|uniref:DUF6069 family protein n=1 Tax=Actinocorallia sp. B10E7 TaxID=3153558 RepID=UPI00325CD797
MSTPSAVRSGGTALLRGSAVIAAVLADVLIWIVADVFLESDLRIPDGPGTTATSALALPAVAISVAVISLAGWALLAVLERLHRHGRTAWTVVALLVLVLSLFAPLFSPGLGPGNRVALVCLHLAAAAILIPAYRRR